MRRRANVPDMKALLRKGYATVTTMLAIIRKKLRGGAPSFLGDAAHKPAGLIFAQPSHAHRSAAATLSAFGAHFDLIKP